MVFFLEQNNAFTVEYGHYLFLKTIIPSRKATFHLATTHSIKTSVSS